MFNHHDLINNEDHYERFKRRVKRLLTLIESGVRVVFVYRDEYTNNHEELVALSRHLASTPNIYVLGIFDNTERSGVMYESKNCKIYQNMSHAYIFGDVITKYRCVYYKPDPPAMEKGTCGVGDGLVAAGREVSHAAAQGP